MSKDSAMISEGSPRDAVPDGLLLRKKAIESHLKDSKITVHGLPRAQLPITCYGTMYSSSQYDKMLKKKELITADTQLLNKKQEFTSRMNDISKKKMASKQRWDEIKQRFESFVPYIEEDRVKKFETLQKYKLELQELNKREQELQKLKMELQMATERNNVLQSKVKKYQVYADFLTLVGEKNFNWKETDGTSSSPCNIVIKRHQTLVNTREDILSNMSAATMELEKCQKDIEMLQNSQVEQNLREQVSRLERRLDYLRNRNAAIQDDFYRRKMAYCKQISQLNAVLRAIDNLTWLCCKQQSITRELPSNIDGKLRAIQYGIISKQDVINSIKHSSPG